MEHWEEVAQRLEREGDMHAVRLIRQQARELEARNRVVDSFEATIQDLEREITELKERALPELPERWVVRRLSYTEGNFYECVIGKRGTIIYNENGEGPTPAAAVQNALAKIERV